MEEATSSEPKAPQVVTELYCQVNKEICRHFIKLAEFIKLDEFIQTDEERCRSLLQTVVAQNELDKYANEQKKETLSSVDWNLYNLEYNLSDSWCAFRMTVENTDHSQYLPFEENKIKGILEKMVYITKVMTRPEFRALVIEYNNNVLNCTDDESIIK